MKFDLTEQDLMAIFDLAHREWLGDTGHSRNKKRPEKYLLARSYFIAVTSFLAAKGYTIELNDDKNEDKG